MFKDMTIRSKLTGSFAVILILTSLVGYFGYQVDLPQLVVPLFKLEFPPSRACIASGAGGLYPSELCGRNWLYSFLQFSIST